NAATNVDVIQDFGNVIANNDTIALDNAIFTKLGAAGPLNPSDFFLEGAPPARGDAFIEYDPATGELSYDSNGILLAGGMTLFATLAHKPTLTAADFVVV